jgi:hypothetical protein
MCCSFSINFLAFSPHVFKPGVEISLFCEAKQKVLDDFLRRFFRQAVSRVGDDDTACMRCILLHVLAHLSVVCSHRQEKHGKLFLAEPLEMGIIQRKGAK